jgi:hypothetical protein
MPGVDASADVLIGLTSWGYGCASQQYPGVYARVSDQIEWIKTIVCNESSFPPRDLCESNGTPSPTTKPTPTSAPVSFTLLNTTSYLYISLIPSVFIQVDVTNSPTSSGAAGFVKLSTAGHCLDASGEWYSAFKSTALPLSSTDDSFCLNWCGTLKHSDLVAVEIYRDSDAYCYCDFPGGSVPNDLSVSSFDPPADKVLNYPGDGAVISTDLSQGAVCYKYVVSQCKQLPQSSS